MVDLAAGTSNSTTGPEALGVGKLDRFTSTTNKEPLLATQVDGDRISSDHNSPDVTDERLGHDLTRLEQRAVDGFAHIVGIVHIDRTGVGAGKLVDPPFIGGVIDLHVGDSTASIGRGS